jgi:hypothetical protein
MLEFRGVTKPMIDWAEELHIPHRALAQRVRHGWSLERAMTTPHRVRSC